jgi:hypothetical protein
MEAAMKKFKVRIIESERGWGQDYWYEYFDTLEEAQARYEQVNKNDTLGHVTVPDYYIFATKPEIT